MNLSDEHIGEFIQQLVSNLNFESNLVNIILDGNNKIGPSCLENFLMKLETLKPIQ
jgi:hypothetical protein